MDFEDIKYERIDYNESKEKIEELTKLMDKSNSFKKFEKYMNEVNKIRKHILTMNTVSSIRFSINTKDKFYKNENSYWDETSPLFSDLDMLFYRSILNSNFEKEIVEKYGKQFYRYIETLVNSFSKDIIPMLQKENKLMSEYTELLASASINFDGKICNLSDMYSYMGVENEEIRKNAIRLHTKFFEDNEEEFDSIFDKLVKIRDEMAKKMGFENFIELGYLRMNRTDYDESMVEIFRENIYNKYLPIVENLYLEQAKRINAEKIDYYNEMLEFVDGNARLQGDGDYIMSQGRKMYKEMSQETGEFIDFLMENNLFDVQAREGKAMGGYCTIIHDYNEPFIFGNFNGTVDDVDVLTHEAGHAFQVYMSRELDMPELIFPTLDSCEIFSMSMEFFTYPWMELFFGDDAEKYKKYHYDSALKFLPYGILVDHFQHEIYRNPKMSPKERKEVWRKLEKRYLPYRDYSDLEFLERGGYWFRQGHIFKNPFYYIDYVLAQECALQFKNLMEINREDAWNRYIKISSLGGKYSFIELVEKAGLKNPFK
ncbi:M3 family oligoendopeptidase [Peptostreptococcus russellii]|uniref:M3 family oligoendopeptidase n=1 Tax=Peptostreptococcus russellii TaxID=215200 RepID=UPI0016275D06|nr:M3 family oligoendopeptidase [Peptostreptococcus russellii]MBC2577534.1 M3 family oligoendopeptidase [Peptostreptococcus russellii]